MLRDIFTNQKKRVTLAWTISGDCGAVGRREKTMARDDLKRKITKEAINTYIEKRHKMVEPFVDKHFSFKGAWHINKKAFGKDMLKTPANVAWSIPYLGVKGFGFVASKLGAENFSDKIKRVPQGFTTDVQREVEWLVYTELFELPSKQKDRVSKKDALLDEIFRHPMVVEELGESLGEINKMSDDKKFRSDLEKKLAEYTSSRTAAADIASSMLSFAAGYAAFQKATPGALGAGSAVAAATAQSAAISGCWAGETLGGLYYGLFPAAPSLALSAASIGAVMIALGVFISFSGLITDPAQKALGLHQRKMHKLLDKIEAQLLKCTGNPAGDEEYKLYDRYVARVFDFIDLLKPVVKVVKTVASRV